MADINIMDLKSEKKIKKNFFVLGMHRSGTSLITQILSKFGLYTGNREDMLDPNEANKDGYFEIKKVVEINDEILLENNMIWCCVKENALNLHTKKETDIEDFIKEFCEKSGNKDIAIKDPRFCLLEPIWRKEILIFGMKPKVIVVIRHPYEVAKSLVHRDNIEFSYALKIWFYYNICILNIIIQYPIEDLLFLSYQDFFNNSNQIQKIAAFCNINYDIDLQREIVKKELYHNSSVEIKFENNRLYNMVYELYEYLLRISNKEIGLDKEVVKKFNRNLEKIAIISYEHDKKDMFLKAMNNCHYSCIKKWCLNLLEKEEKEIKIYFSKILKEKNIFNVILYGYGTVSKKILNMIQDIDIECIGIVDKSFSNYKIKGKNKIKLYNKLPEKLSENIYILNTVVNYEDEISALCHENSFKENYISLKEIIGNFCEQKRISKCEGYDMCI